MRSTYIPAQSDLFVKACQKRTLRAWEPFSECISMNFTLQNSDIGDEYPEWRMHWVYLVSCLRIVGHVLDKMDAKVSQRHHEEVLRKWNGWKDNRRDNWIFWEFIELERNSILKTFEFGVSLDEEGLYFERLDADGIQLTREATYWWRQQLEDLEGKLP
ncbi:hypothetical protein ASE23_16020 [Rhizobium sp. Root73]|uniref:hypothetical protein n=1 Tax=unclassified Rhizobium TaxID=2613769 RepID=UPI0007128DF5|nr:MULTISPECIES: hypothetical protein [unclassified Rhizobium]KQV42317.1 hypothetical protein ASC96_03040 [Rhizobium sp. Root1204]KQY18211.1 hypothetical protein ASD36_06460 [Rhizobium sp. Root1334]KRB98512.1 hypothetical protein ASE23_16020 [Rhizobium sp. Root73]